MSSKILRFLVPFCLTVTGATLATIEPIAWAAEKDTARPRADLTVELRAADGEPIKFVGRTLELGQTAELVVLDDQHEHKLEARVELKAKDKNLVKVILGYHRDDQKVFEALELELPLGGPAATRDVDGNTIKAAVTPRAPRRDKIEMPDGDDPLTGI